MANHIGLKITRSVELFGVIVKLLQRGDFKGKFLGQERENIVCCGMEGSAFVI